MQRTSTGNSLPKPPLNRVLLIQCGLLLLASVLVWLRDAVAGRSILLGGLIFLVPQSWFAWRVFRARGAKAAGEVLQGFYSGEAGKILLAVAGFAVVFALVRVRPLDPIALFGAYVVLLIANAALLAYIG